MNGIMSPPLGGFSSSCDKKTHLVPLFDLYLREIRGLTCRVKTQQVQQLKKKNPNEGSWLLFSYHFTREFVTVRLLLFHNPPLDWTVLCAPRAPVGAAACRLLSITEPRSLGRGQR